MTREKAIDLLDNLNGMIEDSRNSDYDTAFKMAIKALEQEPILDKIKAEIDEQYDRVHPYNISCAEGLEMALEIIDKYKTKSEDDKHDDNN